MTCQECQDALIDYHYGELDPERRARTAEHLGGCSLCAMEYCRLDADLSGVTACVDDAPRPEVQAALRAKVRATFRPPWWRRVLSWSAAPIPAYQTALLLLVSLALTVLLVFPRGGLEKPPATRPSRPAVTVLDAYDASSIIAVDPHTL